MEKMNPTPVTTARLAISILVFSGCAFGTPAFAGNAKEGVDPTQLKEGEEYFSLRGEVYPLSTVSNAYVKARSGWAFDHQKSKLMRLKEAKAVNLTGTIDQLLGPKGAIVNSGRGNIFVRFHGVAPGKAGDHVFLVGRQSGTYSHNVGGDRVKLDQYQDMTMSFDDFITWVNRGHHFPEAKEIKTGSGSGMRNSPNVGDDGYVSKRHKSGFKRKTTYIKGSPGRIPSSSGK